MAKRGARRKVKVEATDPLVNMFAAEHGDYQEATVVDLTGELGGQRQSMVKVLKNQGATQVDRWFKTGGPGFEQPQRRAIDWVLALWHKAGHAGPVLSSWGVVRVSGIGDGQAQQDALTQLSQLKSEFPGHVWSAFEDIVRHDKSPGAIGRDLTAPNASAQNHARACVGFVASMIAMWRGY